MKPSSGSATGSRRRAGQARRRRRRQPGPGGRAARRLRRARRPAPVWGPLLEGLLLLEQKHPERFMQACRSVAFYLSGLDARRLQRQLFTLKPDPAMAAERR
jgi:hypothetical protein